MAGKKRGLGKPLNTILTTTNSAIEALADPVSVDDGEKVTQLAVEKLQRGKYQPRREMDSNALEDLANSIKAQGILQPILARKVDKDKFEIIAGERRWRAAQLAGLKEVPTIIREIADEAAVAMALIENIQREDLNPIEEAMALQRLLEEFSMTHQAVAEAVGRSRAGVSNLLRLLSLEPEVRQMVEFGDLEMGHARALLPLDEKKQVSLARQVVEHGMSVRETEKLVRKHQEAENAPPRSPKPVDPDVKLLERNVSEKIGAGVRIKHNSSGNGRLVIKYNSLDELDNILAHIH